MTDAVRSDAAPNPAGNSNGGNGGAGAGGGGHGGNGGGKGEKKKCPRCGLVHHTQAACWEVCTLCGRRHHFRAPCQLVQDPQRRLVEENRALHERSRILEQELAQVRGQLHTQMQINNLLQQQAQGSIYSSPFSLPQPAMQPQALQAPGMQPLAWEQPRVPGSFSGFRRSKQVTNTRSGPPHGAGSSRGGKGSEGGDEDATKSPEKKEVAAQPKKRAEASKEKIAELRKKQAEAKKQPAEKKDPSSTPADNCDQAASTEGKKQSRGQRRRGNKRRSEKEKEVTSGNTEVMEVDEEAQAPTSTGPNDGGAEVSTLPIRERSSEGEAGAVDPAVDPQPQPPPPQQASEPADNSVSGVVDGNGAASGPSEPCQPEK